MLGWILVIMVLIWIAKTMVKIAKWAWAVFFDLLLVLAVAAVLMQFIHV